MNPGRRMVLAGLLSASAAALIPRAQNAGFPAKVRALLALINTDGLQAAGLREALYAATSPLAALPRQIASAWYLGIVGTGEAAVCAVCEHALNAAVVADVLQPPTYGPSKPASRSCAMPMSTRWNMTPRAASRPRFTTTSTS